MIRAQYPALGPFFIRNVTAGHDRDHVCCTAVLYSAVFVKAHRQVDKHAYRSIPIYTHAFIDLGTG